MDPTKENQRHLDLRTTVIETWETMIALKKTGKVYNLADCII